MNDDDFRTSYPNINITVSSKLQNYRAELSEKIDIAAQNLKHLFLLLPEHQRIILNQSGLEIEISTGRNAVKRQPKNLIQHLSGTLDSALPNKMVLDLDTFSKFKYDSKHVNDDWQRKAESTFSEEATHAVCMRLVCLPQWIQAVREDFIGENKSREALLEATRLFYSYFTADGKLMGKQPLQAYIDRETQNPYRGGLQELAYEIPPEFTHIRDMFATIKQSGGEKVFERNDVQQIADHFYPMLQDFPHTERGQPIDAILAEVFPNTYPIFINYENRLKKQADDIKKDPSSYPVLSRMSSMDHFKMHRSNKWDEAFVGFSTGKIR